jgi:hypothetical protein
LDHEKDVRSWFNNTDFRASPNLKRLHETLEKLLCEKDELQTRLSEELGLHRLSQLLISGAKSLNLRWTPGLSHIVHVNAKDAKIMAELDAAKPISASKSTRSYQLPVFLYYSYLTLRIGLTLAHALIRQNFKFGSKSRGVLLDFVCWSFIIFSFSAVMLEFSTNSMLLPRLPR